MGVDLSCVTTARMFVTDISYWEEFGKAHAKFFGKNPPTTTMVEVKSLISPEMMIDIETDGVILECESAND